VDKFSDEKFSFFFGREQTKQQSIEEVWFLLNGTEEKNGFCNTVVFSRF